MLSPLNKDMEAILHPMEEKFLDFWRDLVLTESPSAYKEGVDKVGQIVASFARSLGFSHRIIPFDKAGNGIVIEYNNGSEKKPILLGAHMDTVFDVGTFGEHPFRREGTRVFGPGVNDCKAGVVLGLAVLYALKSVGYRDRPVKLMLTPDEECSNFHSQEAGKAFIRNEAKDAFCALNFDGGYEEKFIVSRFGICRSLFRIRGVSAHAGVFYDKGRSAIKEAAHKIIALEKESKLDKMTFNCGTITGGTVTNVVPEFCKVGIDTRYRDQEAFEEALAILKRVADTSFVDGTSCEFEIISQRPSMSVTNRSAKLAEHFRSCHKVLTGRDILPVEGSRGGSDASNMSETGCPVIDTVGIIGGGLHTLDEWADASTLLPRTVLLTQTILTLPATL